MTLGGRLRTVNPMRYHADQSSVPRIRNTDGIGAKLVISGVVALAALVLTGCRVQSVNEASYVAKNEQVLRGIPVYGDERLVSDYSVGQPASDGSPWQGDNSPPYGAYITAHGFHVPRSTTCATVGDWYRRELPRRGWSWVSGYPRDASYVRGHALVHVYCGGSGNSAGFVLSTDHNEH